MLKKKRKEGKGARRVHDNAQPKYKYQCVNIDALSNSSIFIYVVVSLKNLIKLFFFISDYILYYISFKNSTHFIHKFLFEVVSTLARAIWVM